MKQLQAQLEQLETLQTEMPALPPTARRRPCAGERTREGRRRGPAAGPLLAVYDDDPAAQAVIAELDRRLHEPLRLAIAGMVKAGKSTLLNAMLGEQIAPTDAGECTRVVTWYRYSATPTITLHPHEGEPRRMPVRREHGRLVMNLGGVPAEEVEWIDVGWPSWPGSSR